MKQPIGVLSENIASVISNISAKQINKLRVATFAKIISIDLENRVLTVKPMIKEQINSSSSEKVYMELPNIFEIPYIAGQYPKINDYVVCLHLDRSIENLDLTNDSLEPINSNTNRHNINDCIAIVVNSKEEWKKIGEYSSSEVISESFENYTQLKIVLVFDSIQMVSNVYDISLTTSYRSIVNDGTIRYIDLVNNSGIFTITPHHCSAVLYAR